MPPPASIFHRHRPASPVSRAAKAAFWDRTARKYATDRMADPAGYEATLVRVQGLLEPRHAVLELGCGTGTTALRLAPSVRRYLGTDVSAAMVGIAREKLAAQPLQALRFAVAEAESPVSRPARHDVVLAFNLLHLVTELDATLRAVHAALHPGGLFVSKTACIAEMNWLVPRLALPLMRALGRAPHALVFDAAALRAAFERNGFAIEAVERHGTKGRDIRVFVVARRAD